MDKGAALHKDGVDSDNLAFYNKPSDNSSHELLAIHFQKVDVSKDKFLYFPNSNCQKGSIW